MANLLTVEHVADGEHVQLTTLQGPLRLSARKVRGYPGTCVLTTQLAEGSQLECKVSTGTLQVVTAASPYEGYSVLATTNLGHGQTVQLETPMGTLAARAWDPDVPPAAEELAGDAAPATRP